MRSFTFDSDKIFFVYLLLLIAVFTSVFYFYVENKAHSFASKNIDERYINFTNKKNFHPLEIVIMGTSHSERSYFFDNTYIFNLAFPHSIPTAMYFRAKTLIKFHPEVKVVYLEADDHLFFNGKYYNLDGLNPTQKRNSKIFLSNSSYIDNDDEKYKVFGEVAPYSKNNLMLLEDDVKPVIIKRIVNDLFSRNEYSIKVDSGNYNGLSCDLSAYKEMQINKESEWSKWDPDDKNKRYADRIVEHNLNLHGPMKEMQLIYYEKTIAMLKKHNIDVVLVFNPVTNEFASMKNRDGQKLHQKFIYNLAEKYKLRVLDTRDLSNYGERIFEDGDHISHDYGWLLGERIIQDFCANHIGSNTPVSGERNDHQ